MGKTVKVMLDSTGELPTQGPGRPIRNLIFFVFFYLYIWLAVDLRLIYHGGEVITNFPAFYRGWVFFRGFISRPGGIIAYLSALLSQFFCIGWAGALAATMQALLVCVCCDYFLKAAGARRLRWARFVPAVLVLVTYAGYTYHCATMTALLTALAFVCLYLRIAAESNRLRLAIFVLLSVILYYIAGGAYLLFAVSCAIYELLFSRRRWLGLSYLLLAGAVSYVVGVFIFGVTTIDAFTELLPVSPKVTSYEARRRMLEIIYILYLFVPLTALLLGLWRIIGKRKVKAKPSSKSASWFRRARVLRWGIATGVLFAFVGICIFFSHNNRLKNVLEADYYAYRRMWPEVLETYHPPVTDFFIIHAVNRALYHTGRLSSQMFSYPQHPEVLFLTGAEHTGVYWKKADTYIDLGHINQAEIVLIEAQERLGRRPMILERLALINLVKGKIGAARVYLTALGKTLFFNDWANDYLTRLEPDSNLSKDENIQRLRSLMLDTDYDKTSYDYVEDMLTDLLKQNRQNRMAFEYLMASYLLTRQMDKFAKNLERLDDFDYSQIPRHYEEAIVIYEVLARRKVDLKGRKVSSETMQRAVAFDNLFARFRGGNERGLMLAAGRDFGDTYFFYYKFGP